MSRIEDAICQLIQDRAAAGLTKYGVTLERDDLSLEDWLTHAIEESLDRILYLYRAREKLRQTAPAESESIPWAEYPWARWAAKDEDGRVHVYSGKPFIDDCVRHIWIRKVARCKKFERADSASIPGHWRQSLRARPEGT